MVDIPNHEDSLRELSKTSLVNNVTIVLCWSAAEAARYLELYKSYEHAGFAAIRGQQATSYAERLVEFVTVPRSINKADAVGLVSTFGSLRAAVNAEPDQVAVISGWGERKVKAWCKAVEEPFRVKKASKRGLTAEQSEDGRRSKLDDAVPLHVAPPLREMAGRSASRSVPEGEQSQSTSQQQSKPRQYQIWDPDIDDEDEDTMMAAAIEESRQMAESQEKSSAPRKDDELADGVAAALAKLREKG